MSKNSSWLPSPNTSLSIIILVILIVTSAASYQGANYITTRNQDTKVLSHGKAIAFLDDYIQKNKTCGYIDEKCLWKVTLDLGNFCKQDNHPYDLICFSNLIQQYFSEMNKAYKHDSIMPSPDIITA